MSWMQRHPDRRPADRCPRAGRWSRQHRCCPWAGRGRHLLAAARWTFARPILLVDEDDFSRPTLARILEADGYRVWSAADEGEARGHLRRHGRPGLILLDLSRPWLDDWDLLHAGDDPVVAGVPIILVSTAAPAEACGCPAVVAHFGKPVQVGGLLAAVRHHLLRSGRTALE